jgi:hypothetical protein
MAGLEKPPDRTNKTPSQRIAVIDGKSRSLKRCNSGYTFAAAKSSVVSILNLRFTLGVDGLIDPTVKGWLK